MLNMFGYIDVPSSGTVLIDGTEVEKLDDKELTRYRRTKIGFIFQSFNLIPVLNVYENIEFPLLLKRSLDARQRKEMVMRFVEEVGLQDRLRNKPNELSGGQRQRVAIGQGAGDQSDHRSVRRANGQPGLGDGHQDNRIDALHKRGRADDVHILDPRRAHHARGPFCRQHP